MDIEQTTASLTELQHEIDSTRKHIGAHQKDLDKALLKKGALREQLLDLAKKAEGLSGEEKADVLAALGVAI